MQCNQSAIERGIKKKDIGVTVVITLKLLSVRHASHFLLPSVKYAQDRENGDINYYAEVLRECMEGIGTSEGRLIYHIIMRCEVRVHL